MSEVITDKDYIKMVVRGEHKSSRVEITTKSINCAVETTYVQEGAEND